MASLALSHALIQVCLSVHATHASRDATRTLEQVRPTLAGASAQAWGECFSTMHFHRLTPLVGSALSCLRLAELVPQPFRQWFLDAYHETVAANTVRLLTLDGILQKLSVAGITPVLWKGVVLADSFYPDLGMRMMGDIDFAIAPEELSPFTQAIASLGFVEEPEKATTDAIYLRNGMGMLCDVHHRIRLFEGKDDSAIYYQIHPRRLKAPSIKVLSPDAMMVHLVVHMLGHRPETGPILQWILDLAFVLQQWGDRLDPTHIRALLPDQASWVTLLKTLRFLEAEWGVMIPAAFTPLLSAIQPFTFGQVLRQRRLALWGLPHLRGWMKLGVAQLMGDRYRQIPPPHLRDLLLWPIDLLQSP